MAMEAQEFNRLVRQRGTVRAMATKDLTELGEKLQTVDDTNLASACRLVNRLKTHFAKLEKMDDSVLANIKEADHDAEATKVFDYQYKLTDGIAELEMKIKQHEVAEAQRNAPRPQVLTSGEPDSGLRRERVPYMELTEFDGNPLNWEEFWDDFKQSVDERSDLTTITKFKLLRKCLTGTAAAACKSYQLTSDNYSQVKSILEERYGDKETAVALHLEALVKLKTASSHSVSELVRVRDECEAHIRALVILGFTEDTFGQLFAPILLSKLPKFVRLDIRKQKKQSGEATWSMQKLREVLSTEIELRSTNEHEFFGSDSESSKDQRKKKQNGGSDKKQPGSATNLFSSKKSGSNGDAKGPRGPISPCAFCSGKHYSPECGVYPDVDSRIARLGTKRCFLCLREGHQKASCRAKPKPCFHCKRDGHHSALCLTKFGKTKPQEPPPQQPDGRPATMGHVSQEAPLNPQAPEFTPTAFAVNTATAPHYLRPRRGVAVLASAMVTVAGETGMGKARIVFDDGAMQSYISEKLSRKIGATRTGYELIAVGRFGEATRQSRQQATCEFSFVLRDGSYSKVEMNVEKHIAPNPTLYPVDIDQVQQFCDVSELADIIEDKPTEVEIDILFGLDYRYAFMGSQEYRCPNGLVIKDTKLGYVVTGYQQTTDANITLVAQQMLVIGDQRRDPFDLEKFWRLEDIGIKDDPGLNDDEAALQHFNTTAKVVNSRYAVQWPFKEEPPDLPSNYQLAHRRLNSVLRRLKGDESLLKAYDQTFKTQESLGIIEKAPLEPEGVVHHLCHHAVLTPQKTTTKLRVVFDASAKPNQHTLSLNESMHRGPVFLNDLCGILIRFRLSPVAIVSDVEKAFLQISLQMHHRDCTRFLWLHDLSKPLSPENTVVYRYAQVLFGAKASPFLLAASIMHHTRQIATPTSKDIEKNTYVDNVFSGQPTTEAARRYYADAKSLFDMISMNLREWYSNDQKFIAGISETDRGKDQTPSVLGIKWSIASDRISVPVGKFPSFQQVTKRNILRSVATVYDPCGWFGPVTVRGKMIMQDLWSEKKGWDEPVADAVTGMWTELANDLRRISDYSLPRSLNIKGKPDIQLHCFCDASEVAYGAVVYLRRQTKGKVECSLLFAKSRVTPLRKKLSIPKLELVACSVGSVLMDFVSQQAELDVSRKIVWSDNSCVLSWLHSKELSTVFVTNRVKRIRAIDGLEFRHVPTSYNPVDLLSRGTKLDMLMDCPQWWHGPSWMLQPEPEWPENKIRIKEPKEEPIVDQPQDSLMITSTVTDKLFDLSRFSTLRILYGTTCYVIRALNAIVPKFVANKLGNLSVKTRNKCLTAKELHTARTFWDKRIQQQHFPDPSDRSTPGSWRNLQQQLGVFQDDSGLLRCRGRFQNAQDLRQSSKFPILLPKNSCYTNLIVRDYHVKSMHGGPQATLAAVRCQYWIPQARNTIKHVLNGCRLCRRHTGGPFRVPEVPPLPHFRSSVRRPFACVGLDYLGPLMITDGERKRKVWVALFTCAVIRAIHLDVVPSLNTNDFLLCLRRFIAAYGKPDLIVSDNAKQFRMADRVIQKLWLDILKSEEVQSAAANEGIEWKFITELSPWMGGFYERMIRPVKQALRTSVGPRTINQDELQTLLVEIAAVVNERPLLYQGTEPSDKVLTPAAHLMFRKRELFPEVGAIDEYQEKTTKADELVAHWKKGQKILRQFWDSWKTQYLLSLREKPVKHSQRAAVDLEPAVGMTVLIKENLPRGLWRFGRIESLVTSADGKVRSAKVKLANGHVLARPLKLLCPLEMSDEVSTVPSSPEPTKENASSKTRPRRRAAEVSAQRTKQQLQMQ